MTTLIKKASYRAPACELMRPGLTELLCVSNGGIEDIDEEEWINE